MSTPNTSRRIIIIGGGIIGATTALYLSRHPSLPTHTTITLLEASVNGIGQGASGKAGGLVARWAYPKELVKVSFDEHAKLAKEFNGKDRWGYRIVGCGSWSGRGVPSANDLQSIDQQKTKSLQKTQGLQATKASKLPADLDWVASEQTYSYSSMAPDGDTAQVHPYLFTTSMLDLAIEHANSSPNDIRVSLMTGCTATDISFSGVEAGSKAIGVSYNSHEGTNLQLPATDVIVTAGAWTNRISAIRNIPILGTRAHSVTLAPPPTSTATIAPYVLFSNIDTKKLSNQGTEDIDIEIYPRPPSKAHPNGEFYICGAGDNEPLPNSVDDVKVDENIVQALEEYARSMGNSAERSSDDGKVLLRYGVLDKKQACYLPVVAAGGPIIGEYFKGKGRRLYIAAGHTCWGICNAPGTAKALAELVLDGHEKCTDLSKFQIANFVKVP